MNLFLVIAISMRVQRHGRPKGYRDKGRKYEAGAEAMSIHHQSQHPCSVHKAKGRSAQQQTVIHNLAQTLRSSPHAPSRHFKLRPTELGV